MVIGDHNYAEGSSHEHAALEPRCLGGLAVICGRVLRGYTRRTRRSKGMLTLTFVNEKDYDKVKGTDRVTIKGLESFAPGKNLELEVKRLGFFFFSFFPFLIIH